jgi:4'-phosphopantetheinyl transferase EntD
MKSVPSAATIPSRIGRLVARTGILLSLAVVIASAFDDGRMFTSRRIVPRVAAFDTRGSLLSVLHKRHAERRLGLLRHMTATDHSFGTASSSAVVGYERLFDLQLPEGRCVGLKIDNIWQQLPESPAENLVDPQQGDMVNSTTTFASWVHDCLHPDEVHYASQLSSDQSQVSFLGGRLALRLAMGCRMHDCILLKDRFGRPQLPANTLGSISHKGNVAVALVADAPTDGGRHAIGVDLEYKCARRRNVARRILTSGEQLALGQLASVNADEEVLLRFSAKEAIYKAMHPLICQYVGFLQAETQPLDDGTLEVELNLPSGAHKGFESVSAHWRVVNDDFFLTSAEVHLLPGVVPRTYETPEECVM